MTSAAVPSIPDFSKDDDEIDLDDENDHVVDEMNNDATNGMNINSIVDIAITSNVILLEQADGTPETKQPLSKAEAMKLRMRQLKQKMNQARQLNQQAVREEGEAAVFGSGRSKQQYMKKHDSTMKNQNSSAIRLAQEHGDIDPKLLLQPAYENLSKQQRKQEKDELNQYAINDYHNPEGQYRNYQRNIKSLPNRSGSTNTTSTATGSTGLYDPTDILTTADDVKKQRDGAHRISQELQRRYDKRQMKDRKRKQSEIRQELNDTSTTNAGASGINLRNQKFNQKIARTYDKSTSEIRHNLERGTAL